MTSPLRITWTGFHTEGLTAFRNVLKIGANVNLFITLDDEAFGIRSSGSRKYIDICAAYNVRSAMVKTIKGDSVASVIVCKGESLRYKTDRGQKSAMQSAANVMGVGDVTCLNFPDQHLDKYTLTDIIAPLEKMRDLFQPDIVYCQFGGDINLDHKILFEAVNVVFRPIYEKLRALYAFYTASSTEWAFPNTFKPNLWIDISHVLDKKIAAFECYESEVRAYPHPRSSKALRHAAHFWGNQCCMDAAEVFMTVRQMYRE